MFSFRCSWGRVATLSYSIVRTYTDALLAADAGIRIFDVNVLVYPEVDFANDLFRTGFDTLPASLATAGIDGYEF